MRIEATAKDIRALLQLIEADQGDGRATRAAGSPSREAVARKVPRDLLARYRSLDGRRAPVLAAIENGACSGCHMRLPTMLEYRAHQSPAIHTCPCCRRMLYVPELLGEGAHGNAKARPARRAEP